MSTNDVQQTPFSPPTDRADIVRRWPDLLPGSWAGYVMGIREAEESVAQQPGTFPAAIYRLRHLPAIREINAYLKDHPDATVMNMDCGFGRITHEIADTDSLVYNVDLPEVVETRECWVESHAREVALPYSAIDHRWMDHVDACKGLVAIATGVFYYFEVDEVKALVREMGARFPGSRLCYNAEFPWVTAGNGKNTCRNDTPDARMPFRVKNLFSAWIWSDRINDVHTEFDFSSCFPASKRAKLPRGIHFAFRFSRVFRGICEVATIFKRHR